MNVLKNLTLLWLFCLIHPSLAKENSIPENVGKFLNKYCIDCHGPKKQKADFRVDHLKMINASSTKEDVSEWQDVLDNLHLQEMPPEDELQPDLKLRTQFTDWIDRQLKIARKALGGHTGEVVLRRLNSFEYNNTIKDIFDLRKDYTISFPEDAEEDGFNNNGAALMLSAAQINSYMQAAKEIVNDAINFSPRPQLKSKTISLSKRNSEYMKKQLSLFRIKKQMAKMTPQQKEEFKKKLARGVPYPAIENGRMVLVKLGDSSKDDYAIPGVNGGSGSSVFNAEVPGWYKYSVKAYALNTKGQNISMKIVLVKSGNTLETVAQASLKENKAENHSFKVYLQKGESIRIGTISHGLKGQQLKKLKQSNKLNSYKGPFAAVRSLSMEGPIIGSNDWPPKSHKVIFGNTGNADKINKKVAEDVFNRLAPKLFRRPVDNKTKTEFLTVYDSFSRKEKPLDALKTMLQVMLVAPQFLYNHEGQGKIDDFALASRLSYFLWRSSPDLQLLKLAASKKLSQKETLSREIKRLLADEKSKRFIKDFAGQWLQINRVGEMQPERVLYPEYNDSVKEAMLAETHGFIEEILYKNLSIDNLIDSDWTILNQELAKIYKIPNVKGLGYRKVKLDKSKTVRGGLLTHASILNVTSNGTTTSPITRGVWVLDKFLGRPASAPPPNVPVVEPDIRGATTIKEQLKKHRETATCNSCHKKIDPYGVALESFDVIGQFRDHYSALMGEDFPWKVKGKKVEPFDAIPGKGSYKNFVQFREILKKDKELVYQNLAHKLATFALGRSMNYSDDIYLKQIVNNTARKDLGLQTMVYELIMSPIFTKQ